MLTRRNMITMGAAGAFASALRPVLGAAVYDACKEGEPAGFGDAVFKCMKLKRITVPIGLPKPVSMVQASDTHLIDLSREDFAHMGEKAVQWYETRLCWTKGAIPGIAAAILYAKKKGLPLFHTGDLLDFASRGNLDAVKRDFEGVDWFYAPGNHEYAGWGYGSGQPAIKHGTTEKERETARKAFEKYFPNPFPVASRVMGGINFVQYDNGGFCDLIGLRQLEMIKQEFAKGLPVVLLCHMPFYTDDLGEFMETKLKIAHEKISNGYVQGVPWAKDWTGRKELLAWLKKQPLLKAVVCGHLHREILTSFSDTAKQYVADANFKGAVYEFTFT